MSALDLDGWLLAYAAPKEGAALADLGAVELGLQPDADPAHRPAEPVERRVGVVEAHRPADGVPHPLGAAAETVGPDHPPAGQVLLRPDRRAGGVAIDQGPFRRPGRELRPVHRRPRPHGRGGPRPHGRGGPRRPGRSEGEEACPRAQARPVCVMLRHGLPPRKLGEPNLNENVRLRSGNRFYDLVFNEIGEPHQGPAGQRAEQGGGLLVDLPRAA